MKLRPILFWAHLVCGVVAGVVILIMSVTGALLTYQRQMTAWADMRGYDVNASSGARRLPPEQLVAMVRERRSDLSPTTLVVRADPRAPASLAVGQGRTLFVNPYSGDILGEGQGQGMRNFFRVVTDWHRYLAGTGENRARGRAMTGAANLAFLFVVLSGMFLWWPRTWTWVAVRNITWFKRRLPGKARDFNWHNTIGFWSAIPLAIIVAGGVVISYPWASGLVYRAYGEEAPVAGGGAGGRGGAPGGRGDGRGAPGGRGEGRGAGPRGQVGGRQAATAETDRPASAQIERPAPAQRGASLAPLLAKAEAQMPDWRSISVALPAAGAARVVLTLDSGDGGQPNRRGTLTLDSETGETIRWEPFSSQSPGRRARTWLRFAHTGEVYGLTGQTIAGIVSAGGAVLVWTGLALAYRRLMAWRKRLRQLSRESAPRSVVDNLS